jgi:hypothetical protein
MDQRLVDLAGAIVRQAFEDVRTGYYKAGIPDARRFLVAAGLMADDGTFTHGTPGRRKASNAPTQADYNARRRLERHQKRHEPQ